MISKLFVRYGRRQLHTIVSKDVVKPSSPTPSHLKTYNFSLLDRLNVDTYSPVVTFFENSRNPHDITIDLKNSLSKTLTRYYPFAGQMAKTCPTHVDCNDHGVEFIEARNHSRLSDFLENYEQKDLDQLIANELSWYNHDHKNDPDGNGITSPLAVQVNHFACGGIAVAVSLSHKVGDGSSCLNFINHWATVTRSGSLDHKDVSAIDPHFIGYKTRNRDNILKTVPERPQGDCVLKRFVFSNSKLKELKAKVAAMSTMESGGQPLTNTTRAEVLTWLIHKCAMTAAMKTNSGIFKPSGLSQVTNLRTKLVEKLPETTVGNIYQMMEFPTSDESDLSPNAIIGQIKKKKMEVGSFQDFETLLGMIIEDTYFECGITSGYYIYSFLNRFPSYGIDFGWGKPVKVTIAGALKNVIIMMDVRNGDGIEALVPLGREDMKIFEKDPELLAFC